MMMRDGGDLMLGPVGGMKLLELPTDYGIVEANLDRYSRAGAGHREWAARATEATDFAENRQWTEAEKAKLREEGRPCVTKNYIMPLLKLAQGYFSQNDYDITVLPAMNALGKQDVAETFTHIIKMIGEANGTKWNDIEVFMNGRITGRAFWDVRLNFQKSVYGDITERVMDEFDVRMDPEADTYDPANWSYVQEERWLSIADILTLFGPDGVEAAQILTAGGLSVTAHGYPFGLDFDRPVKAFGLDKMLQFGYQSGISAYGRAIDEHLNLNRKLIRAIDCQHRVLKRVNYLVDLETGMEKILPHDWPQEKLQRMMQWVAMRQMPVDMRTGIKKVVRWTTTAGDRVLWDDWSPYDDFTVIPYFPYFRKGFTQGAVEPLVDQQREINKRASSMLHIIMTTANSGWIEEENSLDEINSQLLSDEGARPGIRIKYKKGSTPPQKIQPSVPPTAMKMLEDTAKDDMKFISNINDSFSGTLDRVQSGRAVLARQKQSAVGLQPEMDNFSRSKELKGRKMVNLIQNFYTEERVFRTVGDDGTEMQITINKREAAGDITNNVITGAYEVAVDESPMSATFMQGQFEEGKEMIQLGIQIPPDIMVDMSSMPKKKEIKQRLKEQAIAALDQARVQDIQAKASIGVPPNAPVPPVATGGPAAAAVPPPPSAPQVNPPQPSAPAPGIVPPGDLRTVI